ncbi:MAG: hypothetical protein PHW33_01445 [Candidatus Portnoybacteria bacterium]|jgi:hypothetical protein|nr:hypothetical protein [Candidatus Portnoybacteria bacterium]
MEKFTNKNSQTGAISVLMTMLVLGNLLIIASGISALLLAQVKMSDDAGESVPAFYAADAGAERCLFEIRKGSGSCDLDGSDNVLDNQAVYRAAGSLDGESGQIDSTGYFNSLKKVSRRIQIDW